MAMPAKVAVQPAGKAWPVSIGPVDLGVGRWPDAGAVGLIEGRASGGLRSIHEGGLARAMKAIRRAVTSALFAVGCLSAAPLPATAEDLSLFRIGTGGIGGTYYPVASLVKQVISTPAGRCGRGESGGERQSVGEGKRVDVRGECGGGRD